MATHRLHYLSKSRLMAWRQCPLRLWQEVHTPELREDSADAMRAFDQGHQVGEVARSLVPGGILIGHDEDLSSALRQTEEALERSPRKALFEATFRHEGLLVRADILAPERSGYRLVEVKAAASVKEHFPDDVAIQAWTLAGAGVKLAATELAHVESGFVYPGGGDYRGLLSHVDLAEQIGPLLKEVPKWLRDARQVLHGLRPDIAVGDHCHTPRDCPFLHICTPEGPEYPVSLLPDQAGKKLARELAAEGYADLRDVPAGRVTRPRLARIWRTTASGKAELDPEAGEAVRARPFPRYFMDFETIAFAVPVWAGTRPYQQLPFQWSCHIETAPGKLAHREFLDASGEPPMRRFIESLLEAVGNKGPVFVYHHFEKSRLNELKEMYPDLAPRIGRLVERLVDLLPIAKQHYYHPAMKGSWSIKQVLPTVAPDLSYENLGEVQEGGAAQDAYLEIIHPETPPARREELVQALRRYCQHDTLALVRVAHFFAGQP